MQACSSEKLRKFCAVHAISYAYPELQNVRVFQKIRVTVLNEEMKIKKLKEDERPVKSLNSIQTRELLSASKPYQMLSMRILLALSIGLRDGDIESLTGIDFENSYVTTRSSKSRKNMGSRPVPVPSWQSSRNTSRN